MPDTSFDYGDGSTILDIDTSDAQEPAAVPEGEYKIRITGQRKDGEGAIVRTAASGSKYFIVTFDLPEEPLSKGLSQIFSVPTEDMEPKRVNASKWQLECFKRTFGLSELNFDSMVGKEGYALLRKTFSEEYGEQNDVKKFITGA